MTPVRIAVVGSGPAGLYALEHLLNRRDIAVEVDVLERLPTPWGLVRAGVAPDHPEKKLIVDRHYTHFFNDPRVSFLGGVDVGSDVKTGELSTWYDAVVYATGADDDAALGVPGEDLSGCWSARELVAWYNGHPDFSHLRPDLLTQRAVIVGNGNVALDVARVLTIPVERLARTDIADHALAALGGSALREVMILGRRSPMEAAFHNPELEEFEHLDGVDVVVEDHHLIEAQVALNDLEWGARRKLQTLQRLARRPATAGNKRIVFRFLTSPAAIVGEDRVTEVRLTRNRLERDRDGVLRASPDAELRPVEAGLVVAAVGYRGSRIAGLPFDEALGVISHCAGRITDGGVALPGAYVTGWIKRGCRGVIGSNKRCARETIDNLFADVAAGLPVGGRPDRDLVMRALRERRPGLVTRRGWAAIDRAERTAGRAQQRPRVKVTETSALFVHAANG